MIEANEVSPPSSSPMSQEDDEQMMDRQEEVALIPIPEIGSLIPFDGKEWELSPLPPILNLKLEMHMPEELKCWMGRVFGNTGQQERTTERWLMETTDQAFRIQAE